MFTYPIAHMLPPEGPSFSNDYRLSLNGTSQRAYTTTRFGNASTVGGVSMWVEFKSLGSGSPSSNILMGMNSDPTNNDDYIWFRSKGDQIQFIIRDGDSPLVNRTTNNVDLVVDTLYHIYFGMTTTGIRIWVDGVDHTSDTSGSVGDMSTQYTFFNMGNWSGSSRAFLGGFTVNSNDTDWADVYMDEVAFFDDALTDGEIEAIAAGIADLSGHDHLVEYYRFENNPNDSNGSNNLTLEGSPSYDAL